MTESTLQLDIPVLLPNVQDERDQCVERLNELIASQKGIQQAHVDRSNGQACICLHYDPNLVTLQRVQRVAEQAGATISKRYRHENLHVTGMDCADCARSIEHILARVPGVIAVSASYAAEKVRVEHDSNRITRADLVRRIGQLGYGVQEQAHPAWWQEHQELLYAAVSGVLLLAAYLGQRALGLPAPVTITLYALAYVAGGFDAALHGVKAALKLRFEVDFLMVVAALGAAALGDWAEGGLLLFLFSLGHGLEHFAMDRARHAVEALSELAPRTARVREDGGEREVPVDALQRGNVVIVRSGERVPVDGRVLTGRSALDQSPVTGESMPVEKQPGDGVFAGSINGEGALEVEVTRLAQDSTLARVIQMVEEAQTQKSPTQRVTERFTSIFVPLILGVVVAAIMVPPLAGWLSWQVAFLRAMTVLVAASPCALAIAAPSAVLSGIAQAARHGVLIKGGMHLENLGSLQAMAFDKTGTLTTGRPEVTDVIALNGVSEREVLRLAAAAESRSGHPLAQAILRHVRDQGLELPAVGEVQTRPGYGISAELGGTRVEVGNLKLFGNGADGIAAQIGELEAAGKTTMIVRQDALYVGIIALADQIRPEARGVASRLQRLGVAELVMLTGDNERVAAAVARTTGMSSARASLLPDEKLTELRALMASRGAVAMVGDGVNDAPALAAATVGIAMGAGGTDVALETADVALMASDLSRLPFAVGLSRASNRVIRQNLAMALGVIALLVPAALLGLAGIGPAIVLHEGSTVAVVLNALRLLRYREA